jgi:hypothetical protein
MKFAVIVYETAQDMATRSHPDTAPGYMAAYGAYSKALSEAGIAAGGAGLQPPSTATTLRVRGGKRSVQDGPFADSKEQLGGIFVIDVPDLDTALQWAAKCPSVSTGCVEVRPMLGPPPA